MPLALSCIRISPFELTMQHPQPGGKAQKQYLKPGGNRNRQKAIQKGNPTSQQPKSKGSTTSQKATCKAKRQRQKAETEGRGVYLEHHLELCREGEEGTQHGTHGHEHQLKEQQASQIVHS